MNKREVKCLFYPSFCQKLEEFVLFFENQHIYLTQCARSALKIFEYGGTNGLMGGGLRIFLMGGGQASMGGSPPPTFGNPGQNNLNPNSVNIGARSILELVGSK